jgi:hypothetical protein
MEGISDVNLTEAASDAIEVKQLTQIDLHLLTEQLAGLLTAQVGGECKVVLQTYENTNPGCIPGKLLLNFVVTDRHLARFMADRIRDRANEPFQDVECE